MSIFQSIYAEYFRKSIILTFNANQSTIDAEALAIFKQPISQHDSFFTYFTPIWQDYLHAAEGIWHYALSMTWRLESANTLRVHKGTPYYFLGVTQILNAKIDDGFYSMHQALEEDILTHGKNDPPTPAYWFTILDNTKQNQFFGQYVTQVANYLEQKIAEYVRTRSGTLTISDFRTKFLESPDLREEVFRFVYYLSKIKSLLETPTQFRTNEFSSVQIAKHLFDISLISEKAMENKHPQKGTRLLFFPDELAHLRYLGELTHNDVQCKSVRDDLDSDFNNTLTQILKNTHSLSLPEIDYDFILAYYLRNFGAHNLINQQSLNTKIDDLNQRILNTLFYVIEHLY